MIVVYPVEGGFRWKLVGFDMSDLVLNTEVYPTDKLANSAACAYRSNFWRVSRQIDGRMASAF